jgi:hypothetical protein
MRSESMQRFSDWILANSQNLLSTAKFLTLLASCTVHSKLSCEIYECSTGTEGMSGHQYHNALEYQELG